MREEFKLASSWSGYNGFQVDLADYAELIEGGAIADRVDHAHRLAGRYRWKTINDIDEIFPSGFSGQPINIIGGGLSLKQVDEGGQLLQGRVRGVRGVNVYGSRALGLLNSDRSADEICFSVYGNLNPKGVGKFIDVYEELREQGEKFENVYFLWPTYLPEDLFDYVVAEGLGDKLVLWDADIKGVEPKTRPLTSGFFPGGSGPNAALGLFADLGAKNFTLWGVDGVVRGEAPGLYANEFLTKAANVQDDPADTLLVDGEVFGVVRKRFLDEGRELLDLVKYLHSHDIGVRIEGESLYSALLSDLKRVPEVKVYNGPENRFDAVDFGP